MLFSLQMLAIITVINICFTVVLHLKIKDLEKTKKEIKVYQDINKDNNKIKDKYLEKEQVIK